MELPKTYDPKESEKKIYKLWIKSDYFNPDNIPPVKDKKAEKFVITIAPPNVTGSLHMGHALENILVDILIRKHRMQGDKTLWLPGTDHAGIATQNVVEKDLKKEGLTRFDLGREKFIERTYKWKEKYGNLILNGLKMLGCSCDWSRLRFTMDADYISAVEKAFAHYYEKGLIYRGERVINWCSRCGTSLSDLELEHKEINGKLWYIRYPIKDSSKYIVVATTRPETMLGDTAVAVNPEDTRYKALVGQKVILPIQEREIPIIADKAIDLKFGTGAVKITPAHDPLDAEIAQRHNLPFIKILDENGKMTAESKICESLRPNACREKVLKILEEKNILEKTEDYTHSVPHCERCNTRIEPLISKQWFVKMDELAKSAANAVRKGDVILTPEKYHKLYFNWLDNIRDWCISRQLWWGHRIPIWFCQEKNDYFLSIKPPKKCVICGKCKPKQSEDVLDTWFSSALWPFATLGWPKKTKDLEEFYPTTHISSARDIINLWMARMVYSGLEFTGKTPFKTIHIHPTVLTKDGRRMSKSLGTGVDPLELIEKYGADATRFGIVYQNMGNQDIHFTEDEIMAGKKFCNKIWNASRFVLTQIGDSKFDASLSIPKNSGQTEADKKILRNLDETVKKVKENIDSLQFGHGLHSLYDFFWHDFCDYYIENAKNQIAQAESSIEKKQTQEILFYVLISSLKLLHPFIPFVTEEIYQKLPLKNKKALLIERWPN